VRTSQSFSCGISLYAVADGHNGSAAARYVSMLLPEELERQLGGKPCPPSDEAVQQALARAFMAVDAAVSTKLCQSGGVPHIQTHTHTLR
jgi:serine/threonine protein phosphatase PrpC